MTSRPPEPEVTERSERLLVRLTAGVLQTADLECLQEVLRVSSNCVEANAW